MKTFKKTLGLALLSVVLAATALKAQQDPMVSQYPFSGHFVNPAYAGSHDYTNITLLARKQWVGFDGAPLTSYLSFDMPVAKKHIGFGGILSNDIIGVTNRSELAGTFAYHLQVGENAKLAFGLRAGITYYTAKLSELTVWDNNDAVFANDVNGKILPNAGLGAYFYMKRFYAGISIPAVINYEPGTALSISNEELPLLERHYYFISGVVIPAGPNVDIKPAVLVKYVPNAPVQADFNLSVLFNKVVWVGASWRTGDGILGMVEYQATKNLRVGYAYDMSLTHLQNYNSGSHEIMIAWDFVKDETLRYKSPRFF